MLLQSREVHSGHDFLPPSAAGEVSREAAAIVLASIKRHIVSDVQEFASNKKMQLNPVKCKEMRVNFLHYNSCELQPIVTGGTYIEEELLWCVYL